MRGRRQNSLSTNSGEKADKEFSKRLISDIRALLWVVTVGGLLLVLGGLMFSGCSVTKRTYPLVEYQHSAYAYDLQDKCILVEAGHALSAGHPYDIEATDTGYDLILHFEKTD